MTAASVSGEIWCPAKPADDGVEAQTHHNQGRLSAQKGRSLLQDLTLPEAAANTGLKETVLINALVSPKTPEWF
jgi:hypothetical protein